MQSFAEDFFGTDAGVWGGVGVLRRHHFPIYFVLCRWDRLQQNSGRGELEPRESKAGDRGAIRDGKRSHFVA